MEQPPYNIQRRTFLFAAAVVTFCRDLTDAHPVTRKLSWQLLDAATSVGANMEEADGVRVRRTSLPRLELPGRSHVKRFSGSA